MAEKRRDRHLGVVPVYPVEFTNLEPHCVVCHLTNALFHRGGIRESSNDVGGHLNVVFVYSLITRKNCNAESARL